MATNLEVVVAQRRHLMSLLKIKKYNVSNNVTGLEREILTAEAEMEQEDVAWVEKKVAELKE